MCDQRWMAPGLLLILLIAVGCSSGQNQVEMGHVTGQVFVDGEPAGAGLQLEFAPVTKGVRGSTAVTDDSGYYEAIYSLSSNGVRVGPCVVKLVPPATAPPVPGKKRNLPFPEPYYDEIRQITVSPGQNTIDLEISKK
ncbi:hypothetical protein [Bremerella alba]|uniref:Carboxypeptidase regulatory-like domain-containing protein n=1 Tax=Bremerella alba TaxID=980252 RepID=A0A7V8V200_9BACT|nr:hypothetical protein [Bremerella alba]MBA2113473.1 hypothetical protein [Bremerella alba]